MGEITTIAGHVPPRGSARTPAGMIRWLTALGLCTALGMFLLGVAVLLDMRRDAWRQAEEDAANLAFALERDIARNVELYDLTIQDAIAALQLPGFQTASPSMRRAALFSRVSHADYMQSLLVLDARGDIAEDSESEVPRRGNFADRDYFQVHRDRPGAGLYASRPFMSRLNGSWNLVFSRRLAGPDGGFAGIAAVGIQLAYFEDLFGRLDLGPGGSVTLFRDDGVVLARHPLRPADIGRDLGGTDTFRRFAAAPSGRFTAEAPDGVQRLHTFRHVGRLPLILGVALPACDIYAAWRRKALVIGPVLVALCGAAMALCLLFRREMLRRMAAERALAEAARRLAVMATTDGLTGLANRRQFDLNLKREWRRALRNRTPLALLLLDADRFKSYNDRHGHQGGDRVLRSIAASIRQAVLRPADAGARYGGEEFAVLLPETDLAGAVTVAERLRATVAGLGIPHEDGPGGRVTVSIGVAGLRPVPGQGEDMLVRQADRALYAAKAVGRDTVCVARPGGSIVLAQAPEAEGPGEAIGPAGIICQVA